MQRKMHTSRVIHNKRMKRLLFHQERRCNLLPFALRENRVRQSSVVWSGVWWILQPCVCEVIITRDIQQDTKNISKVARSLTAELNCDGGGESLSSLLSKNGVLNFEGRQFFSHFFDIFTYYNKMLFIKKSIRSSLRSMKHFFDE